MIRQRAHAGGRGCVAQRCEVDFLHFLLCCGASVLCLPGMRCARAGSGCCLWLGKAQVPPWSGVIAWGNLWVGLGAWVLRGAICGSGLERGHWRLQRMRDGYAHQKLGLKTVDLDGG